MLNPQYVRPRAEHYRPEATDIRVMSAGIRPLSTDNRPLSTDNRLLSTDKDLGFTGLPFPPRALQAEGTGDPESRSHPDEQETESPRVCGGRGRRVSACLCRQGASPHTRKSSSKPFELPRQSDVAITEMTQCYGELPVSGTNCWG
jgi:hypothetical protein